MFLELPSNSACILQIALLKAEVHPLDDKSSNMHKELKKDFNFWYLSYFSQCGTL